jgi:hypothetical protein
MKEYIPSILRNNKPIISKEGWGIGFKDKTGCYGMTHGPFFSEVEALEIIGEKGSYLIHFFANDNGSEELYR